MYFRTCNVCFRTCNRKYIYNCSNFLSVFVNVMFKDYGIKLLSLQRKLIKRI